MDEQGTLDIIETLIPNFSAMFDGGHDSIIAFFVAVIIGIFLWALYRVIATSITARKTLDGLIDLLAGVTAEGAYEQRSTLSKHVEQLGPRARHIWTEFDETLVVTRERDGAPYKLSNTCEAEVHFNLRAIAPMIAGSRLLQAVPATLTALGLLGTFIGLAFGLNNLELGNSATVDELKSGIENLVAGASLGFTASVWGVFFSVLFGTIEKFVEGRLRKRVENLQNRVDEIFPLHTAEKSLASIERSTADSATALAELHEKIGTSFQQSIQTLTADMQDALSKAIQASIAPTMDELSTAANNQSETILKSLLGKIETGFDDLGGRQAEKLHNASATLETTLDGMGAKVEDVVRSLRDGLSEQHAASAEQSEKFATQLTELADVTSSAATSMESAAVQITTGIGTASGLLSDASTALGASAGRLDVSAGRIGEAADAFDDSGKDFREALEASGETLERTITASRDAATHMTTHSKHISAVTEASTGVTVELVRAAETVRTSFVGLDQQQRAFLEGLRSQVEGLTATMHTWLDDYGKSVDQQVGHRMNTWNEHTQEFSAQLVGVAREMTNIVSEIEVKQRAQAAADVQA